MTKLLNEHQIATIRETATGWRERDGKTDAGTAAGLLFVLLDHQDALAAALDAREREVAALREALSELRMMVLEADALAVKDEDAEGFISGYEFQTGTWHRLLAYVYGEAYAALAAPGGDAGEGGTR